MATPAAAAAAAAAAATATATTLDWVQKLPATNPPPVAFSQMAYDAAIGKVVLFGGEENDSETDQTWTFDGTNWEQQHPATSPPPTQGGSMAFDAATGQVILFGGLCRCPTSTVSGLTWGYDGTTWTQLSPAASPPPLLFATMSYDAATRRLVLVGGEVVQPFQTTVDDTDLEAETWTYDGTTWTKQFADSGFPARDNAAMDYDAALGEVVLYGGMDENPTNGVLLGSNETWAYNGSVWTQLRPATNPGVLISASMEYDAASGQLLIIGGTSTVGAGEGDGRETWAFNGSAWQQQFPATQPPFRFGAAIAYDSATSEVVLYGGDNDNSGQNDHDEGDTWVWTPTPARDHGYWLVGADGGIFTFGSAQFYGSTGALKLQRPVVGITPAAGNNGYWLVAADGGIFTFGQAGFYGSIPGLGIAPAGSAGAGAGAGGKKLNAPIVGMVPSVDGRGYFMVGADGGVFTFGDAQFEGSCPSIGGCLGAAVAVVPDATGKGYFIVTQTNHIYPFGDAQTPNSTPNANGVPVTSAARTADGKGFLVLLGNGTVDNYGTALPLGGPMGGSFNGLDPATAIFTPADMSGYWVTSAEGAVYPFGGVPNDGGMSGQRLNAPIIAATGF
ncbi:MAG TPA: hypothetical protein VHV57_05450 [Acidimicrobiales bacterium]|jgi:hypothetical protein|nr:hypothetical protein [Acidimicrobiales bacterium]